jgi:hypothetical protein
MASNAKNTLSQESLRSVGLPPVIFMYTLDQICGMISVEEDTLRQKYLYYIGRSSGRPQRHHMEAVNIAPDGEKAEWRVTLKQFVRWLKRMGFKTHELSYGV